MTGDKDKLLNERNELITKCNYRSRRRGRGVGGVGVGERVEVNDVFPVGFFCMFIMCVL